MKERKLYQPGHKVAAVRIELMRAEGPIAETQQPMVHFLQVGLNLWEMANQTFRYWAASAPKLGYDKCDFTVTYADGLEYKGRYDLMDLNREQPNLRRHVEGFVMFHSGKRRPSHVPEKAHADLLNWNPEATKWFKDFEARYEF